MELTETLEEFSLSKREKEAIISLLPKRISNRTYLSNNYQNKILRICEVLVVQFF